MRRKQICCVGHSETNQSSIPAACPRRRMLPLHVAVARAQPGSGDVIVEFLVRVTLPAQDSLNAEVAVAAARAAGADTSAGPALASEVAASQHTRSVSSEPPATPFSSLADAATADSDDEVRSVADRRVSRDDFSCFYCCRLIPPAPDNFIMCKVCQRFFICHACWPTWARSQWTEDTLRAHQQQLLDEDRQRDGPPRWQGLAAHDFTATHADPNEQFGVYQMKSLS